MTLHTNRRFWFVASAVAALLLALLAVLPAAFAQGTPSINKIELIAEISAINGTQFLAAGFTVDATNAEFYVTPVEGTVVKIEGALAANGLLVAREVKLPDATKTDDTHGPGSLELKGTLDSYESGVSAVVSGMAFRLAANAEVEAGLQVGQPAKVEARLAEGGLWVAWELKLFDGDLGGSTGGSSGGIDDNEHCVFEVEVSSASLRSGPGMGYETIGFLSEDTEMAVLAIDGTGSWVHVMGLDGSTGWVALSVGDLEDDCSSLGVSGMPFQGGGDDDDSDDGDDDHGSSDDSDSDDHGGDDDHDDGDDDHGSHSGSDDHGSDDDHDDGHDDDHDDD